MGFVYRRREEHDPPMNSDPRPTARGYVGVCVWGGRSGEEDGEETEWL